MAAVLRIGSGAGFSGDRIDAALTLAERGALDWLALECLAERTIALAQLRRRRDPASGFDPQLHRRMRALLPIVSQKGTRIITNMGAANPMAAGHAVVDIARQLGIDIRVAVVTGDDVLSTLPLDGLATETHRRLSNYGPLVSANAYLGAEAMLPAIESGADVIITGRVADPSLFVAPIVHRYGWSLDDWDHLAAATSVGHLLECAGQLCGGYFADPGRKDVPDMANLGFPYADVEADGSATLAKVVGTGGCITLATAKEQLLYEVTDPCAYLTPDVSADFSTITLQQLDKDRVRVEGARADRRPEQLKVSVGYMAGFVGEGEIGYAGPNAGARGELAAKIIQARLEGRFEELRIDLIGSSSLHGRSFDSTACAYEVRLRVAGRARTAEEATIIGDEVEALYTNGPAGGGGARRNVYEQVGIISTLIDREWVKPRVTIVEREANAQVV